jgi:hypothetical protein
MDKIDLEGIRNGEIQMEFHEAITILKRIPYPNDASRMAVERIEDIYTDLSKIRDQLEQITAEDFSYYLYNLNNPDAAPIPSSVSFNMGIAIGRIMQLDNLLSGAASRTLDEIKESLYSRLP